jgi:hypothetical protein
MLLYLPHLTVLNLVEGVFKGDIYCTKNLDCGKEELEKCRDRTTTKEREVFAMLIFPSPRYTLLR